MENQLGKIEYPRDRGVFYCMHSPEHLQAVVQEIEAAARKAHQYGMPTRGTLQGLMQDIDDYNEEIAYFWSDHSETIEDEMWEAGIYAK